MEPSRAGAGELHWAFWALLSLQNLCVPGLSAGVLVI